MDRPEGEAMIEEVEAPHVGHGKSGIAWLDLALAIAVLVLSGASLLTAQHTGHTMEQLVEENSRLVRANATPLLQFTTGNVLPDGRGITLSVANVGTGPARVIWFELRQGDRALRNVTDLIGYQPRADVRDYVMTSGITNSYVPAGEERQIVTLRYPNAPEHASRWNALDASRFALTTTACFCSVLGECWTSTLRADIPKPVDSCEPRGRVSFLS